MISITLQLLLKSLGLCMDILQDMILYGLKENEDRLTIKKSLMDIQVLNYPFLKPRSQILLCCLIGDDDCELLQQLCVEEKVIKDIVQQLELQDNVFDLVMNLRRIESLAKVRENAILLKHHRILQSLESIMEMYPKSEVETLSAKLIYYLSESFDDLEEKNPFDMLEKFITACFKGKVIVLLLIVFLANFKNIIAKTFSVCSRFIYLGRVPASNSFVCIILWFLVHDMDNSYL